MDGMKVGKRQRGGCSCVLSHSDAMPANLKSVIEISQLHTEEWHRNKGHANKLMDSICEDADKSGSVLMLMPAEHEWLVHWYETHGFQVIQTGPVLMARPPYKG
jgi:ribosomal protein S18 acetylase RimI-like enzyme